jgi:hypothetical protein
MSTIYIGGWARFRQECDVTKKEAFEDFSWMAQQESTFNNFRWTINDPSDFEDCRDALKRVEGGTEYLKNYEPLEEGEGINFNDPIGEQIKLGSHHSGGSYYSMLWTYKALLNDWDGWVLAQKERGAFEAYRKIQVKPEVITSLYYRAKRFLDGNSPPFPVVESELLESAAQWGLKGGIEEIYPILSHLFTEHMARTALEAEHYKKRRHHDLVGGLKWKYKHPSRWFDTPWGSSISPTTPASITEEAFQEMEAKYPGYRAHIQKVNAALRSYRLPPEVTRYSKAGEEYTKSFLTSRGIIT